MMSVPFFVGVFLLTEIAAVCIFKTDTRLSGRLHGSVYRTIDSTGELQCGYLCLVTQKCLSINYERQSLTCQLSSTSDRTSLITNPTWSYLEKPDIIDVFQSAPCTNWTCPPNSLCVRLSSGELTCMIIGCDTAPNVPNAEVSVYQGGVADQTTYTCNTYYLMSGTGNVTCKANGTFTEPDFSCELIPCQAAPMVSYAILGTYQKSVGSEAPYSCKSGYSLTNGPAKVTCELGGQWSTVTFSCDEIPCSDPPSVPNAGLGSYQKSVGSEGPYTCITGYKVSDGPAQIECLLGGQWSTVDFSCDEIPCQAAPMVSYAILGTYQKSVGSEAPYSCKSGYSLTNGPAKVTCELGGQWSTVTFSCDEIPCSDPPSVPNASLGSYQKSVGSEAPYTCITGYKVSDGPAQIECLLGGQWSSVDFSCNEIPCQAAPMVSYAILGTYQKSVGSEAPYSCKSGYSLTNGPAKVTCELGGQWSTVKFSCAEIPCNDAPSVNDAVVNSYQKSVGSEATYTCKAGYQVSNGPAKVKCELGGQWSTVNFHCEEKGGCPSPPEIDNAFIGTLCQTTGCSVNYNCNIGYFGVNSPTIECRSDGSWTTSIFFCEPNIHGTM